MTEQERRPEIKERESSHPEFEREFVIPLSTDVLTFNYRFSYSLEGSNAKMLGEYIGGSSRTPIDDEFFWKLAAARGREALNLAQDHVRTSHPHVERILVEPAKLQIGTHSAWETSGDFQELTKESAEKEQTEAIVEKIEVASFEIKRSLSTVTFRYRVGDEDTNVEVRGSRPLRTFADDDDIYYDNLQAIEAAWRALAIGINFLEGKSESVGKKIIVKLEPNPLFYAESGKALIDVSRDIGTVLKRLDTIAQI